VSTGWGSVGSCVCWGNLCLRGVGNSGVGTSVRLGLCEYG